MLRERILHDSHTCSGHQSGNRTAPRHGKKDDHQQGQVENGKQREPQRNEGLEKEGQQQHDGGYYRLEAIDFNLLPRCVGDRHYCGASVEPPAGVGACVASAPGFEAGAAGGTALGWVAVVVPGLPAGAGPDGFTEPPVAGFTRGPPTAVPFFGGSGRPETALGRPAPVLVRVPVGLAAEDTPLAAAGFRTGLGAEAPDPSGRPGSTT